MMRLGLCCLFQEEKIAFRTTTAKALAGLSRRDQLSKVSAICRANVESLHDSLRAVSRLGIGAFRIMSPLFPRMTHPEVGYRLEELADAEVICDRLAAIRGFADDHHLRLSFHPDQFVVLSSPHPQVVANSIRELEYQAVLAEAVGADVINIHAGGVYGDKNQALSRFRRAFALLSPRVASRLTVENDDVSYTVRDLLPLCAELAIPLVYDIHHHRCNPDGLGVAEATELAGASWQALGREQYCHLSSPRAGWQGGDRKPHADYIDPADFPLDWLGKTMTVDVEAKAKELAVVRLQKDLAGMIPAADWDKND